MHMFTVRVNSDMTKADIRIVRCLIVRKPELYPLDDIRVFLTDEDREIADRVCNFLDVGVISYALDANL